MAEQLLDDPQISSALEQMGRERVAQRVRADALTETGATRGGLDRGPRLLTCEAPPPVADEQRPAANRRHVRYGDERRSRFREPATQPVERDVADRHDPLAVALADDAHESAVERQVLPVEADSLPDPDPGRVQELEQ